MSAYNRHIKYVTNMIQYSILFFIRIIRIVLYPQKILSYIIKHIKDGEPNENEKKEESAQEARACQLPNCK